MRLNERGVSRRQQCFLTCLLLLVVKTLWADGQEARQWLQRMAQSSYQLDYHGIFVYERGGNMQSLRLTHAVVEGQELDRLEYLDGDRREVLRHGKQLQYIHPGSKFERLYQRRDMLGAGDDLLQHYRMAITGEARVAGREGVVLRISPRDDYRFGYRMVLDKATGLLLRSECLNQNGLVLERFQFASIDVGELPVPVLENLIAADMANDGPPPASQRTVSADEPTNPWRVGWVPDGFRVAPAVAHPMREGLTFSDGLAAFSVFLEPHKRDDPAEDDHGAGMARNGATIAYTRPMDEYLITVVGEVPRQTAERVAHSLQWDQE